MNICSPYSYESREKTRNTIAFVNTEDLATSDVLVGHSVHYA